jgi:hypothetical protein
MTYSGSFNGFTFGDKARPGASVRTLSGWRVRRATLQITEGNRITAGAVRPMAGDVRLGLNLHASTAEELDGLIDDVLAAFAPSSVPMPLTIGGRTMWVYVLETLPETNPDWPGPERTTIATVTFRAVDGLYSATQHTAINVDSGSPVSTASGEAANAGTFIPGAPRAWDVRMTAHGTTTNPKIRVDHADGSFEQIEFVGLTMGGGQVLTIAEDLYPRVDGQIVSGRIRSTTETGGPSRAARWWRLLRSTGSDGQNDVTVSVASGTFHGYVKTRDTFNA